jgi:hypothetical protein
MKSNIIRIFTSFVFTINIFIFGAESDVVKQARQWFEWGEYDRITEMVPSYLSDTTESLDTGVISRLHLYLGVAYYAKGEVGKARSEFLSSLQINPSVTIDKQYVSSEIMNLFQSTVEEYKQKEKEREERKLLLKKTEEEKIKKQSMIDSLDNKVRASRRRAFLISAITTSAMTIGFAGASIYEYYAGEEEYDKFRDAAQQGDQQQYDLYKDEVEAYNTRTVLAATASGVCALSSTLFYIITHKYRSKQGEKVPNKVSLHFDISRIQVNVTF